MSCLCEIRTKSLDSTQVMSIRFKTSLKTIAHDMGEVFGKLCGAVDNWAEQVQGAPFTLYHDMEFNPENIDAEACIPLKATLTPPAGASLRQVPAYQVVWALHKGSYKDTMPVYCALFDWMGKNGKKLSGPTRETYLNNPQDTSEADLLTEIAVPF